MSWSEGDRKDGALIMPLETFGSISVHVHCKGVTELATGSKTFGLKVLSPLLNQTGFAC